MRRLLAAIPEDLYKTLKHYTVEKDVQIKDVVAEALRRYLGVKEGGEKRKD